MSEITSLSFPRIVLSYVCLFHETRSSSYWLVVPYLHSLQIRVAEVTWSDMLTTRRALVRAFSGAAVRDVARAKSIGFIGLGRMGSEMALNLFSKRFTEAHDSEFVVCDAIPDSAQSFCDAFLAQFPVAHLRVVLTPAE